jgi:signal transduction histidine kinase
MAIQPTLPTLESQTENASGRRDWLRMGLILCAILVITLVYREMPRTWVLQTKVVQYLYFLPIVVAALWFGWRGGILAALATTAIYLPGILLWRNFAVSRADQYGEALDLLLTGSILGLLADRERQKTRELEKANARLHESFEKLRQSERLSAVGQLAAGLAHEIRNPLAGIEGAADLLQPGTLSDEMRGEFVQIIRKESRRLNQLLTDLLNFARPRSPEIADASLDDLVHTVVGLMAPTAQKAGVTLRQESAFGLPNVECDASQVQQVILNFVMNAIQASPPGSEIVVRTVRGGNEASVEVSDQGSGVTPEAHEQLFTPFFTTKTDGMGMGLPIAQQIVMNHGGEIFVRPNTPKGTIFTMTLPVKQAAAMQVPA